MQALQDVRFVIWIGCSESQGFAFQECLASNVPILVWDVESMFQSVLPIPSEHKNKKLKATSCPAWSPICGERITSFAEMEGALQRIQAKLDTYEPRRFILEQNADEVAMRRILDSFA